MQRRQFNAALAIALGLTLERAAGQEIQGIPADVWAGIETASQGRLGVAVLDMLTGRTEGHRLDERFPMCSTFKWLLASRVLRRVDGGHEQLGRRIRFTRADLEAYSPVTGKHVGGRGMSVAELCEAAITLSDNTAANLLLASVGGPPGVTDEARQLGDDVTRLDRIEPALNEVPPGDPRDTTSPRASSIALRKALLGDGLSLASRTQLLQWMGATQTGLHRLRAGMPADWRVADKTGTWDRATSNDVAVVWPPHREPLVVTAYLTDCQASGEHREATLASVGRAVAEHIVQARRIAS